MEPPSFSHYPRPETEILRSGYPALDKAGGGPTLAQDDARKIKSATFFFTLPAASWRAMFAFSITYEN
jgi:hypothetical protein